MANSTILVADDDTAIRTVLSHALGEQGYDVRTTGTAASLWKWVADGDGDLVITDVVMPDENGLELVPRIRRQRPDLPVIVMSAQSTLLTAIKAAERGAFEYLPKPFDLRDVVGAVDRALAAPRTGGGLEAAAEDNGEDVLPLIGKSPAMQEIYRVMARVIGTDLTVMISGESGTGKELIARALHDYGQRRNGPFVAINMAAIPRELIEAELFGHERGAFTGAANRTAGRFEQANGGTLFLDEIGDMPIEAQTRLLRVLQEGEFTTIGGRQPIKTDVRIIAATHRNLQQSVRQGLFREDLYYRLAVIPIRVPPLRERKADLPALVQHFLAAAAETGLESKALDSAALELLMAHNWPGNVRELENVVRRLAALYAQPVIGADVVARELGEDAAADGPAGAAEDESLSDAVTRHLRAYFAAHTDDLPPPGLHGRVLREVERPLFTLALLATRGNQIKAAAMLGLNRNTLRKKIRELNIEVVRGMK